MGITRCSAEPQHWGPVAQKRGGARTQQHWGLEGPSSEPALCSSAETSGWCGLTRELEPGPSDQKGRQGRLGPAQPSCELLRTLPHGKGVHGLLQSLGCGSHIGGWGGGGPPRARPGPQPQICPVETSEGQSLARHQGLLQSFRSLASRTKLAALWLVLPVSAPQS